MTCVDAAIIKALVEHIGGNPDDVVGGEGGITNTDIPVDNVSWKLENKDLGSGEKPVYVATTDTKSAIRPGVIIKFKWGTNSYSMERYLCIGYDSSGDRLIFTDGSGDYKFTATMLSGSVLTSKYVWGFDFGTVIEEYVPDQIISGAFRINSLESACFACGALAANTHLRLSALESNQ